MGGVSYYDTKRKIFHRNFLKEMEHEDIRSLYEDNQHMLWIGTSRGIYKVDLADKKVVGHYEFENNLVRCVMKDSRGRLWVGSFGSGLGMGDSGLQDVKLFNTKNQFPSNTFTTSGVKSAPAIKGSFSQSSAIMPAAVPPMSSVRKLLSVLG